MLKQRIRALERKLAKQLAIIEADAQVTEHIEEWEEAKRKNIDPPEPFDFYYKLTRSFGYFRETATTAQFYLLECWHERVIPDWWRLFEELVPFACKET
jgi:hypothetical protein